MMEDSRIIRNLRHMAWERSKGELRSMLHTLWDEELKHNDLKLIINEFIKKVEDNGLYE
ncbi:MAG: hypothetical protein WC119_02855 [Synergistaceae bacterium]